MARARTNTMKIGPTSFNVDAVKKMSLTAFVAAHTGKTTVPLEDAYYQITGKKRPEAKGGKTESESEK